MITSIRDQFFKTKLFKGIAITIVVVMSGIFTLPGLLRLGGGGGNGWIVQVNGQEVSNNEFMYVAMGQQEYINLFYQHYGNYAKMFLQQLGLDKDPKALALDMVINNELLRQQANALDLYIDDQYVADKLQDFEFVQQELSDIIPHGAFDQARGINERQLQIALRERNMPGTEFDLLLKEAFKRRLLLGLIEGAAYTPQFELREQYIIKNLRKKFSIVTFDFDRFLKKAQETPVTDEQLQEFFQIQTTKMKKYAIAEKRTGTAWKFDARSYGITVSQTEVADYYNENKTKKFVETPARMQVRTMVFSAKDDAQQAAALEKAKAVHAELVKQPELFANKAKEHSQDEKTASKGGLLPTFARGEQDATLERTAFLLKKDGDISEVITTKNGLEIIQRVSREPVVYKTLAAVTPEIEAELIKQKFAQTFVKDVERILKKENAVDGIATLIKEKKGQQERYADLEKGASRVANELFELQNDQYGVYIDKNVGMLVQLTGIKPKHIATLESIKEEVTKDWYAQKASQAISKAVADMRDAVSKKSLKELSNSAFGTAYMVTDFLKSDDKNALESFKADGLSLEKLFQIEKAGMVQVQTGKKNSYFTRLDELSPIDEQDWLAQADKLEKDLEKERNSYQPGYRRNGFVASLHRNATINSNESLVNRS
ncbi:MAG TPA: peptidylprolyl isomerase [Candidatus Babeliales bacterium]|nr:peptidylprolyl isomerase [Candidatus Babeliales bacterium]